MGKIKDITGEVYGRITVLHASDKRARGKVFWVCECSCGKQLEIRGDSLRRGDTQSCGCLLIDIISTHKMSKSPEYLSWLAMKNRCTNTNYAEYHLYGGRGITVYNKWLKSFDAFFTDMGNRPKGYSLERKDNTKNYSPDNCIWTTATKQSHNRRVRKTNKTGVSGVKQVPSGNYEVTIGVNSKQLYLGTFNEFALAKQARERAEKKYW